MTGGTWDVVVIGGGPSGALAARELAREGVSVLVVDRARFPRWKVCGSCVGPVALRSLGAVGLAGLPARMGAVPLTELLLIGPGGGSALLALPGSVAWSRTAMDAALLGEARAAGASVRTGVRAELGDTAAGARVVYLRGRGAEAATAVRARLVLDASGLGGAPGQVESPRAEHVDPHGRVGLGGLLVEGGLRDLDGKAIDLPEGRVVMVVGRTGYVGFVRLEDGTVDVAAAVDRAGLRGGTPGAAVSAVLADAGLELEGVPTSGWRGTPTLTRTPRSAGSHRCLRIGDALGYVEPFTGEGMGWALASARAVQPVARRALERWDDTVPAAWEAYRAGSVARARRLCRTVSRGLRRPTLVRLAVSALGGAPWLAAPILRRVGGVAAWPGRDGARRSEEASA